MLLDSEYHFGEPEHSAQAVGEKQTEAVSDDTVMISYGSARIKVISLPALTPV